MSDAFERCSWLRDLAEKLERGKPDKKTMEAVRIVFQYAETAIALWQCLPGGKLGEVAVDKVVMKHAPRSKGKTMLVVSGRQGRAPVVTFHTGDAGIQLFHGFMAKDAGDGLKWKPDNPVEAPPAAPDVEALPALPM